MKKIAKTLLLCGFISSAAWAQSPDNSWFVGAAGGASFPMVHGTYLASNGAGLPSDIYRNRTAESTPALSLMGGYMVYSNICWVPFYSFGLNYQNAFTSEIRGQLSAYAAPGFEYYNYQYDIKRQTLLAFFKTNLYQWQNILPFITLAGGVSANTANHYREYPISTLVPRVSPGFRGKTKAYFSYAFSAGFDYIFSPHVRLTTEYNYGYFGHAQTDNGANIPGTNYPSQHLIYKLTANTVTGGIIYYFDEMA